MHGLSLNYRTMVALTDVSHLSVLMLASDLFVVQAFDLKIVLGKGGKGRHDVVVSVFPLIEGYSNPHHLIYKSNFQLHQESSYKIFG